jgi:hypothetical protein
MAIDARNPHRMSAASEIAAAQLWRGMLDSALS